MEPNQLEVMKLSGLTIVRGQCRCSFSRHLEVLIVSMRLSE
jgi:hypothetical protein